MDLRLNASEGGIQSREGEELRVSPGCEAYQNLGGPVEPSTYSGVTPRLLVKVSTLPLRGCILASRCPKSNANINRDLRGGPLTVRLIAKL